ncbi:hypothetical protein ACA758_01710 [Mycoplasmopsis agassizii]|uniref:hypothetical protein n=1 Tax=Mycoplasmopsis agassizii TaxID=33922 RepID=UPI003526CCE2
MNDFKKIRKNQVQNISTNEIKKYYELDYIDEEIKRFFDERPFLQKYLNPNLKISESYFENLSIEDQNRLASLISPYNDVNFRLSTSNRIGRNTTKETFGGSLLLTFLKLYENIYIFLTTKLVNKNFEKIKNDSEVEAILKELTWLLIHLFSITNWTPRAANKVYLSPYQIRFNFNIPKQMTNEYWEQKYFDLNQNIFLKLLNDLLNYDPEPYSYKNLKTFFGANIHFFEVILDKQVLKISLSFE